MQKKVVIITKLNMGEMTKFFKTIPLQQQHILILLLKLKATNIPTERCTPFHFKTMLRHPATIRLSNTFIECNKDLRGNSGEHLENSMCLLCWYTSERYQMHGKHFIGCENLQTYRFQDTVWKRINGSTHIYTYLVFQWGSVKFLK